MDNKISLEKDNKLGIVAKLRSFKVYDYSVFDWVATFIAAVIITLFQKKNVLDSIYYIFRNFIILILIAILTHLLFDIPTRLNNNLRLSIPPVRPKT
jgi:hypothetical protein